MITTIGYSSQTTMCFTKDVKDITALEDIKLNGGECKSAYSLNDMKKDGWEVSDIKINNNDYIYILKKGSAISWTESSTDMEELERKVLEKLVKKQKEEKVKQELIAKANRAEEGKSIYINKCQSCHGVNATEEPSFSRNISTLSEDEFKYTMSGYRNGSHDRGSASIMRPYAFAISNNDMVKVYEYIQSLK
jgi:cytochrome c553